MDEIANADIDRDIVNTYMMWQGQLVFVLSRHHGNELSLRFMKTGEIKRKKFIFEDFQPIHGRIGMVNTNGAVSYLTRIPHRKMAIGMSWSNTKKHTVGQREDGDLKDYREFLDHEGDFLYKAVANIYPTFYKAHSEAKFKKGYVAFDKQFAVDFLGRVHYKTVGVVGQLAKGKGTLKGVILSPEYAHLEPLLEKNYDKTVRTFGSTSL